MGCAHQIIEDSNFEENQGKLLKNKNYPKKRDPRRRKRNNGYLHNNRF